MTTSGLTTNSCVMSDSDSVSIIGIGVLKQVVDEHEDMKQQLEATTRLYKAEQTENRILKHTVKTLENIKNKLELEIMYKTRELKDEQNRSKHIVYCKRSEKLIYKNKTKRIHITYIIVMLCCLLIRRKL